MSTRAVYSFFSDGEKHHVYKHHDGYPSGAASCIAAAKDYAWPLPRFEADEFAAAFVRANKDGGGGVRLMSSTRRFPGDIEYIYEIDGLTGSPPIVRAYVAHDGKKGRKIWEGTLADPMPLAGGK